MPHLTADEITLLLAQWRSGDKDAEAQLWPLIYHELKSLAHHIRRGKPAGKRVGTTTLVHEAYLRLLGTTSEISWRDRHHFFAVAARAMRFMLVDEARRRTARQRDGEAPGVELPERMADPATDPTSIGSRSKKRVRSVWVSSDTISPRESFVV